MSKNAAPYSVTIGGQKADPYRILQAYGITSPAQGHAIKKLLRAGRSHKTLEEDISEVILTLERWKEMLREDGAQGTYCGTFTMQCPLCSEEYSGMHICPKL